MIFILWLITSYRYVDTELILQISRILNDYSGRTRDIKAALHKWTPLVVINRKCFVIGSWLCVQDRSAGPRRRTRSSPTPAPRTCGSQSWGPARSGSTGPPPPVWADLYTSTGWSTTALRASPPRRSAGPLGLGLVLVSAADVGVVDELCGDWLMGCVVIG